MPINSDMDIRTKYNSPLRRLAKLYALGAALLTGSMISSVHAQEVGDASATVVTPLSFISTDDLNFGLIIPSNVDGVVEMRSDGSRTATNGIVLVGGSQQPGGFAGQGQFFQIVEISVGSATTQLNGPGAPMNVRAFSVLSTSNNGGVILNTNPRLFRIGSGTGIFAFGVGATLEVGANQTPGVYSGTWSITLNYQ